MCHARCLSEMSEPAAVGSSRGGESLLIRFYFLKMYMMCIFCSRGQGWHCRKKDKFRYPHHWGLFNINILGSEGENSSPSDLDDAVRHRSVPNRGPAAQPFDGRLIWGRYANYDR